MAWEWVVGVIVFILDVYALYKIWTSASSVVAKLLWTLLIIILPVIGFVIWLIVGPRGEASSYA